MSSQPAFAPVEKTTISSARLIVSASQIWAWVVRLLPDAFSSPRLTTPNAAPLTTMSKGKVDVSFIKHVATNDDFQREVIDHGKDNLLVGASHRLEPCVAPHARPSTLETSPVRMAPRRASLRARLSHG